MLQMFVLALSLYNTRNRGVFLLCKITNLLIYRIELTDDNKSNIFYYDVKIADSLEEFLIKIQEDDNYYLERIV